MNWDALETPLDEPPLFPIEPRDSEPASEHERQKLVVGQCRKRGWKVTAIPNARVWGAKAWNRGKAEGVEWGAADLVIVARGLVAFVEMKNGREMPERHQVDWLNARVRMGFLCGVFRTADAVVWWLVEQGFPVAEVRDAA